MAENIAVQGTAQGARSDVHVPDAVPGPDTFSLEDFIQERCTVPVTSCTVFLDADGGKMLHEAQQRLKVIDTELTDLDNRPKPILGVGEENQLLTQRQQLEREKALCARSIEALAERVKGSALFVEFQIHDTAMPETAYKMAKDKLGEGAEAAELNTVSMTILMGLACLRITRADGRCVLGPVPYERMDSLRTRLIPAESVKLIETITAALNVSNEWTQHIDAGFPGRGADVGG